MKTGPIIIVSVVLILVISGVMVAFSLKQQPVVIAYLGSLSGPYSALSTSGRDGAQLALEHFNERHKDTGFRASFDIYDDKSDQSRAADLTRAIVEKGHQFMIGPFTSGAAMQALPVINEAKLLTIGPVVSTNMLSGQDDWFLRLIPDTDAMGRVLGEWIAEAEPQLVAIIHDETNAAYTGPLKDGVAAALGEGSTVQDIGYKQGPGDGSHLNVAIETVAPMGADVVVMICGPLDSALLAQGLRAEGVKADFYLSPWGTSNELLTHGGRAVEGTRTVIPFPFTDNTPEYLVFVDAYQRRFSQMPTFASKFNYESVTLLLQVISQVGAHPQLVKEALVGKKHQGLQGEIPLNAFGDCPRGTYRHRIVNGTFVQVTQTP